MTYLAVLITTTFLGLNAYVYYFFASEEQLPPRKSFAEFPLDVSGWRCPGAEPMDAKAERKLGVSDYLICEYAHPEAGPAVGVYLGYHRRQVREGGKSSAESSIHPPRHCLPGSGWNVIDADVVPVTLAGFGRRDVNRLTIAKGNVRQIVYYWYHERGRVIADDYRKILYLVWDRGTRQRSDGALVRFTIPILGEDGAEGADAAFVALADELLPHFPEYLPN